ncbi:hypothetical protein D9M69_547970 [compost metagenome]
MRAQGHGAGLEHVAVDLQKKAVETLLGLGKRGLQLAQRRRRLLAEGRTRLDQLAARLVQAAAQIADQHPALQGEMLREHRAIALAGEAAETLLQARQGEGQLLHHQVGVEVRIENQTAVGGHLLA